MMIVIGVIASVVTIVVTMSVVIAGKTRTDVPGVRPEPESGITLGRRGNGQFPLFVMEFHVSGVGGGRG